MIILYKMLYSEIHKNETAVLYSPDYPVKQNVSYNET